MTVFSQNPISPKKEKKRIPPLFTKRWFWKDFLIFFSALILFFLFIHLCLLLYTRHGQHIEVPDFSSLPYSYLEQIDLDNHFICIIRDSIFQKGVAPGTIVDQYPPAGSKVKDGRRIFLTIASNSAKNVELPQLTNRSLREVRVLLKQKGVHIRSLSYVSSRFEGLVIGAYYKGKPIEEGSWISQEDSVDLKIGSRIANMKTLPDFRFQTYKEAIQSITDEGFTVGKLTIEPLEEGKNMDTSFTVVWRQNPPAESSTPIGHPIDLWLSTPDKIPAEAVRE